MSAKYLYGFVNCGRGRRLSVAGLAGEPVSLFPFENVAAVVSESPQGSWEPHPHLVLAHGRVLAGLLQGFAVLPARFGTVIPGERIPALLKTHYPALVTALEELAGKVEWGVRAFWPGDVVEETQSAVRWGLGNHRETDLSSVARAYLERRREEVHLDDDLRRKAEKIVQEVHGSLENLADAAVLRRLVTGKMFFSAAYLVSARRLEAFHTELRGVQADFPGVHFLSTGPWPPYNFVSLELDGGCD